MSLNKTLSLILVFLWMTVIFYLSHQPAIESSELSAGIIQVIMKVLEDIVSNVEFDIESIEHFIRKSAHFFAYLVLGILVINALRASGIFGCKSVVLALGICVLYAISDEVHQLFIPGRSGEVRDVLIDSIGASVGIWVYLFVRQKVESGKR